MDQLRRADARCITRRAVLDLLTWVQIPIPRVRVFPPKDRLHANAIRTSNANSPHIANQRRRSSHRIDRVLAAHALPMGKLHRALTRPARTT